MGVAGFDKPEPPDEKKPNAVPCEVYSRIVGYYRPVDHWNHGKRREFEERNDYDKAFGRVKDG